MRIIQLVLLLFIVIPLYPQDGNRNSEEICLFDQAVQLIKEFEGWHTQKHHPYVGYGHKLLPTDKFNHAISESFADSLLRKDLKQKCAVFRHMGKDSLLLGVLAYNIGEYKVLKSTLYRKLNAGDRDVYKEYVSFRMYNGKIVPSLESRRNKEYDLLFIK